MGINPAGCTSAAVLLLAGASLIVDPDSYTRIGDGLATGIRNFKWDYSASRLPLRRYPWRRQNLSLRPGIPRTSVRAAGAVLVALGFLAVAIS